MSKIKIALCFLTCLAAAPAASAGHIAQIKYVHDFIAAKTGVFVPMNATDGAAPAYVKYLLAAIDKANGLSAGSVATNYQNDPLATQNAIPVENVWDGVGRLFNCRAGGYYKAGSLDASTGVGIVGCAICGSGSYSVVGAESCVSCALGYGTSGSAASDHDQESDCRRACVPSDIAGSHQVSGTVDQTQIASAICTLTSCAAGHYKRGNSCVNCTGSCAASQQCSNTNCTVGNGTCYYTDGLSTRDAACLNTDGNTLVAADCPAFGPCAGGTVKHVTCNSGYRPENQDTPLASCVAPVISSATPPRVCHSLHSVSRTEGTVYDCTGGSVNGDPIGEFQVGGYCNSRTGSGSYASPVIQECKNCRPAGQDPGNHCYCKIHSVNDISVRPSYKYVLHSKTNANDCLFNCARNCASEARTREVFRTRLFNAIGQ
jgi:hypothetical protein